MLDIVMNDPEDRLGESAADRDLDRTIDSLADRQKSEVIPVSLSSDQIRVLDLIKGGRTRPDLIEFVVGQLLQGKIALVDEHKGDELAQSVATDDECVTPNINTASAVAGLGIESEEPTAVVSEARGPDSVVQTTPPGLLPSIDIEDLTNTREQDQEVEDASPPTIEPERAGGDDSRPLESSEMLEQDTLLRHDTEMSPEPAEIRPFPLWVRRGAVVALLVLAALSVASIALNLRQFEHTKTVSLEADRQLRSMEERTATLQSLLGDWQRRASDGEEREQALVGKVVALDEQIVSLQRDLKTLNDRSTEQVLEDFRKRTDRLRRQSGGRIASSAPTVTVTATPLPPVPRPNPRR